jgi:hypothetical protein
MRNLVALCLAVACLPAFGWGPEGHSLVARIAETQLTPAARARIQQILGPDRTMTSIASWADEVRPSRRETARWHFVDIPITTSHFDPERDCAKGDCVISQVSRLRGVLRDPAATADERREALQLLIHFVGDMHQPLHSSNNNDKGGNTVRVRLGDRDTNLHSLWDSGLLGRLAPENDLFPALSQEAAKKRKKWAKGTITEWSEQAHKAGRKVVYGKLPKAGDGQPIVIDAKYQAESAGVLREQIERAGVRLAWLLNSDLQ